MFLKVVKELELMHHPTYETNGYYYIVLKPGDILLPNEQCEYTLASTPTSQSNGLKVNAMVVLRNPECFSSLTDSEIKKLQPHIFQKILLFWGFTKKGKIDSHALNLINYELIFRDMKQRFLPSTRSQAFKWKTNQK